MAESSEAYLLTLGGPQRLRHQRVTGGMRISIDRLPADGLVMLTDDPAAFSQVARYLRRCASPARTHQPKRRSPQQPTIHARRLRSRGEQPGFSPLDRQPRRTAPLRVFFP